MNRGLRLLEEKVFSNDLCASCGACASLCPYLASRKGRVVRLHDCDLTEGRCFEYCPMGDVDRREVFEGVFKRPHEDLDMGLVQRVVIARATDKEVLERGQNGGTVSTLVSLALETDTIQAAVLTGCESASGVPQGIIARNREEVISCAGSSYAAAVTLEVFNRGPWTESERIGVVALPCQALALGKMKISRLEPRTPIDRLDLVIGLFCTWSLDYQSFEDFLKKKFGDRTIQKLDITPPPDRLMKVFFQDGVERVSLDLVRSFIQKACRVCPDMTAEFADISVGTVEGVEGVEGWNTLIVRTDQGERLLKQAEEFGVLECREMPGDKLKHLLEASLLKRRRAVGGMDTF